MRQHIKWLALVLCIWPITAYPASVIQQAQQLLAGQQTEKAYQWLNQHQSQLLGSPKGLYMYGLLALRLGYAQQAYTVLQQVVELAPNNLAAQLDLSIAAIQVGRLTHADELLSGLSRRKGNPSGVDLLIASYREEVKHQLQPSKQATTTLKLGAGYNDNVNLGLLTSPVMLDTINGKVTINVDADSMAIADQYHYVGLTHHVTWSHVNRPNKPWPDFAITAKIETTNYNLEQAYSSSNLQLSFSKALTGLAQPAQLNLTTQWLIFDGGVDRNWRLKVATILPSSQMLELQWDQQNKASIQMYSSAPWLASGGQWFAGLEQQRARAGYFGLSTPLIVRSDTHLDLGVKYTISEDLNAYSPAIFDDMKKATKTLAINANLWRPIGQDERVYINVMWQNQRSNISLFRTRWASVEAGITKQF